MNTEDLKKDLKQLGINPGDWTEIPDKTLPGATVSQVASLTKLRDVLEDLAAQDQKTVAKLREQLARLRHGGGC